MRVRLTEKGRDLARRLRAAEETVARIRAEETRWLTADALAAYEQRLHAAEAVVRGVLSEVTAAIPNNGAGGGGSAP